MRPEDMDLYEWLTAGAYLVTGAICGWFLAKAIVAGLAALAACL